jgi:diguanylate cyclase (GGDEF)-like protein
MPESAAVVLASIDIESIEEFVRLPFVVAAGLGRSRAVLIHRGQKAVGFLVGFDVGESFPAPFQTAILESWSSVASLAVERRGFCDQLSYRARHDSLTGLMNRGSFYERLDLEIARSAQEARGLCMICLDLDGLQNINDRHGKDAGDAVLCEVSRRLRDSVRRTDIAARLGGDEFVVLLPGVDNREEAAQIAKLIRDALQVPVPFGDQQLETGGTLGVAVYPDDGMQAETLLKSADEDRYRKKTTRHAHSHEHGVYV